MWKLDLYRLIWTFGFIFLAFPAAADVVTCIVTQATRNLDERIGSTITINYRPDAFIARVDDGFPRKDELPHRGDMVRNTSERLSFTWVQPGLKALGGVDHQRIAMRISVDRNTGRARLSGQILSGASYDAGLKRLSGRANCKITKS